MAVERIEIGCIVVLADEVERGIDAHHALVGHDGEAGLIVLALIAAVEAGVGGGGAVAVVPVPEDGVIGCLGSPVAALHYS